MNWISFRRERAEVTGSNIRSGFPVLFGGETEGAE